MMAHRHVQLLANVFFYYLLKEPTRSTLLRRELTGNQTVRRAVLAEIAGLAAIGSKKGEAGERADATSSLLSRVRQAGYPPGLTSEEELWGYYGFLVGITNSTYEELRHW